MPGNLNSGRSYLIVTVIVTYEHELPDAMVVVVAAAGLEGELDSSIGHQVQMC